MKRDPAQLLRFTTLGETLAAELLDLRAPVAEADILKAFRQAAIDSHPDHGGHVRFFRSVVLARDLLLATLRQGPVDPRFAYEPKGGIWEDDIPSGSHGERRGKKGAHRRKVEEWRRSFKGNWYRHFKGIGNVTAFQTNVGSWMYVSDDGYSETEWQTADEAMRAAEQRWG